MKAIKTIARFIVSVVFAYISACGIIALSDHITNSPWSGLFISPFLMLIVGCSIYRTLGGELE